MAKQRTIARPVSFSGKALQTGAMVGVTCEPAPAGHGIVFVRKDLKKPYLSRLGDCRDMADIARRSTIGKGKRGVQTVEHFLAALWALGIDNLLVGIDGPEMPGLDGSAAGFLKLFKEAGTVEQEMERSFIRVTEPVTVNKGDSSISIFPDDQFSVSYFIEYDCPSIGREEYSIRPDSDSFEKEIAPARTFCLKKEAEALLKAGFGRGADLGNTLVMDDDGPVGTTLRFKNEPVRHKILDLIGDLYLLGVPVIGKVVARKSGHRLNRMLVMSLFEKYAAGRKNKNFFEKVKALFFGR